MEHARLLHLEPNEWTLESALIRSEQAPDTFLIPSAEERASLGVGRGVKLLFWIQSADEDVAVCERMWVLITGIGADGRYVGVLESMPTTPGGLHKGAELTFGPEHVADIYRGSTGHAG
jgi:hypothetical protein